MPSRWLPQDTQKWVNAAWGEDVTLTSTRTAGDVSADITAAVYRLTLKEMNNSRGVYRSGDVRVTLATDAVGWEPKPGDRVTWRGGTYTVLDVTGSDWTKHWVMTCRKPDIAPDNRQLGTLRRPTSTRDALNRPVLTGYTAVAADVPCRVQPEGATAGDAHDKRTMVRRFTAYLETPVDARASDRFECGGVAYTVLEVKSPEKLGELMALALERTDP